MKVTKAHRITAVLLALLLVLTTCAVWQTETTRAASSRYWLKVNKTRNVVTAYKYTGGRWKPVRAMLCSVGTGGKTPSGTFHLGDKSRWGALFGQVYGQYCCRITGYILFHSVWYRSVNKATQNSREFNKLGRAASHGCVRLATIDAKWIYDNCRKGTRVTIYRSHKSGPLGRPKAIKSHSGWDPTDPDRRNPHFKLRRAKIKISKKKTIAMNVKGYSLKKGVTAKNPNANESLTSRVKVASTYKWNSAADKWRKAKFTVGRQGTWRIKYTVKYPYCRSASKTFKLRVRDLSKPTITASDDRTVTVGAVSATEGVTARQKVCSLTKKLEVYIKAPDATQYEKYTYAQAKEFVFDAEGIYEIRFVARNVNDRKIKTEKTIKVTVQPASDPNTPVTPGDGGTGEGEAGEPVTP